MVIDLFGLDADDVRKRFPEVYQHVLANVKQSKDKDGKPNGRDLNNRESYRVNWWVFGEPRRELRPALAGLPRYIATVETAKHRVFQFLDASILPDNMLVCIALDDAFFLGVLSSRLHVVWALRAGGWLGVGNDPRYSKSRVFDPFPFPDPSDAFKSRIRATAEELDALRKQAQAEHPGLTLTQIYNVLEKLRAGEALNEDEEAIKTTGLVLIVKELHERLDALVAEAYGWPADLSDEDILARLVAVNAERAVEEKRGLVRWLRPDYQRQRAGIAEGAAPAPDEEQLEAPLVTAAAKVQKPSFPAGDLERTAAVFTALIGASGPLDAQTIAKSFRHGAKVEAAIGRVLASLARVGSVHTNDGRTFTLRRRA
jgi:Fe2+ or Zn2+ uptake regulation protein